MVVAFGAFCVNWVMKIGITGAFIGGGSDVAADDILVGINDAFVYAAVLGAVAGSILAGNFNAVLVKKTSLKI